MRWKKFDEDDMMMLASGKSTMNGVRRVKEGRKGLGGTAGSRPWSRKEKEGSGEEEKKASWRGCGGL